MPEATEWNRTLTYRRAVWVGRRDHDLEHYVRLIDERLTTTDQRTFEYSVGELQGLIFARRHGVTLGHIAFSVRGQSASVVPQPAPRPSADTLALAPPEGASYLDGDLMFLVAGDNVLICPSRAHEAILSYYLESAALQAGIGSLASRCKLEPVANLQKLRIIRSEGVKKIRLDASLYEATHVREEEELRTIRRSFFGGLGDGIRDYFRADRELSEIGEQENISVKIEITFDRRRKGGEVGRERIDTLAERLIQDNEDDFRIVTRDDKVIEPNELKIRQKVALPASGYTVQRDAAWEALVNFYQELRDSGALET